MAKVFRLLKIVANQTECSRLGEWSLIKVLVAEKGKPSDICRRMGDICRGACFGQKSILKSARHGFATMSQGQKDSPSSEN